MNRGAYIDLRLVDGSGLEVVAYRFELDPDDRRAIAPLNAGRELGGWAAIDALQHLDARRRLAQRAAAKLTESIMSMIEHRDPVNGYSRDELNRAAHAFRASLPGALGPPR